MNQPKMNTDHEYLLFISSSGHCTLNCPYCPVDPIAKNEASLNYNDLKFIFRKFRSKKILMGFSGKGDFFAGYQPSEKLLFKILRKNVEVVLDINGVVINEFAAIPAKLLKKIVLINLTMHFQQLKSKNLLEQWRNNALDLIRLKGNNLFIGTIVSPLLTDYWRESLDFYKQEIFLRTGTKINIIIDEKNPLNESQQSLLNSLMSDFNNVIESYRLTDFNDLLKKIDSALCSAGKHYFRIWNDGTVVGCPYVDSLKNMGNIKERRMRKNNFYFPCNHVKYCDCYAIYSHGKMFNITEIKE